MIRHIGRKETTRSVRWSAVIALLLAAMLVLTGCSGSSDDEDSDAKNAVATEQSEILEGSQTSDGTETKQNETTVSDTKSKEDSKTGTKASTSKGSSKGKSSAEKSNKGKKWVPAVYKTVEHPAEYATVTVYVCPCGEEFDSYDAWYAHKKYWVECNGGT